MDDKQINDELNDISVDSAESILELLDFMADGEPEGIDWKSRQVAAKHRIVRSLELVNMLNKKAILAAPDIKTEEVFVPEWDGSVMVRGMTGSQRDEFEASIVEMRGTVQTMHLEGIRAKLCSLTIVDEDGRRMFDSDEVDELGAKSAQALQRIFEVAQRLSGLTPDDVEHLAKNLESGGNGASGSASHSN